MPTVIQIDRLSKSYRLGVIGGQTVRDDLARWWARRRGRPDPLRRIGDKDHGNRQGGTVWALRDVDVSVEEGEVLGVIGANGAGKSTLLKILSRITAPTTGTVRVRGRIASLLEVGTGFHPELTGRENVYLNGAILGMGRREIDRKFGEIVAFSGVEGFIDTPVKRYSSGMYVRLAFAVAAHLEPDILLVDEVLAVGDAAFQSKCLGKMGEVARQGRTVLFVSHNMGAVQGLCSRAILLSGGQVQANGATEKVVHAYLSDIQDANTTDLAGRTDREGDGHVRFTGAWLEHPAAGRAASVQCGDRVTFVFEYACGDGASIPDGAYCSATIKDSLGRPIFTLSPWYLGRVLPIEKPRGRWACTIESLALMPDRYSIDLWCGLFKHAFDVVPRAVAFDVVQGDFFGTGLLPLALKSGPVLMRQQWNVAEAESR